MNTRPPPFGPSARRPPLSRRERVGVRGVAHPAVIPANAGIARVGPNPLQFLIQNSRGLSPASCPQNAGRAMGRVGGVSSWKEEPAIPRLGGSMAFFLYRRDQGRKSYQLVAPLKDSL